MGFNSGFKGLNIAAMNPEPCQDCFRPADYSFSPLVLGQSRADKVFYLYFVKKVYDASTEITLNGLRGSYSNSSAYSYVILRSQLTYEFQKTVVHFA